MLRIIDKQTHLFLRDDFTYDEDVEFGLNTEPSRGLYKPKWSGETTEDEEGNITVGEGEWVEGATQEEIDELTKPQPHEPSEVDLLNAQVQATNDYIDFLEEVIVEMAMEVYE